MVVIKEVKEKVYYKGLLLDPFQKKAIQAVERGENVIVAAPTGAGKTLIAEYAIEKCIAEGRRVIYTSPIKALSNQKFRDFAREYGNLIGLLTGDVTLNPEAQVLIMTTEVFRNTIFENPERLEHVFFTIFDEIHYMDDLERGTVWEESIIFAPSHIRFLALSATISNLAEFAKWMEKVRGSKVRVIYEESRPIPLTHYLWIDGEHLVRKENFLENKKQDWLPKKKKKGKKALKKPFREVQYGLIEHIIERRHLPCIYFLFSRASCEAMARQAAFYDLLTEEELREMKEFIQKTLETLSFTQEELFHARPILRLLERGVCYHHAGMLPILKELVERCFSTGLLKLLFATETFALGVNMPAKAVVFDSLRKFNGVCETYIKARDYQQMAGRAGRRGIDEKGYVYSILLSHKDSYRQVRRVLSGKIEPVSSRFNLDYSTLIKLYERLGENFFEAWQKSFATFRAEQQRKQPSWYRQMLYQVEAKLDLLFETGYLSSEGVTEKGRLALKISGYEIHLSELYFHGLLSQLDPIQLSILFSAIVREGKRDWRGQPRSSLSAKLRKKAHHIVGVFRRMEQYLGIQPPIKELDFSMAYATDLWARGYSLSQMDPLVDFAPGDIVRNLRRTIQVLRQMEKALEGEERADFVLLERVREAIHLLKRDMVDAEAQIQRGLEQPDQTTLAAALKRAGIVTETPEP